MHRKASYQLPLWQFKPFVGWKRSLGFSQALSTSPLFILGVFFFSYYIFLSPPNSYFFNIRKMSFPFYLFTKHLFTLFMKHFLVTYPLPVIILNSGNLKCNEDTAPALKELTFQKAGQSSKPLIVQYTPIHALNALIL